MNKILLLIILAFLIGCAAMKKPERPKAPPIPSPKHEVITPEREASNALIMEGQKRSDLGVYDRAADLFQEAIHIDPTNGVGYYSLAVIKVRTGEYGEAAELLEQAERLLGDDLNWELKLEELRRELGEGGTDL